MEYLLLCKGPPIGFVFYTMACLVGSITFFIYLAHRLFNSSTSKSIDSQNKLDIFLTGIGNILLAILGAIVSFFILIIVGAFVMSIFTGN